MSDPEGGAERPGESEPRARRPWPWRSSILTTSVQRVKNHVLAFWRMLRVHRRRDAVRLAYDLGILAEPSAPPVRGETDWQAGSLGLPSPLTNGGARREHFG